MRMVLKGILLWTTVIFLATYLVTIESLVIHSCWYFVVFWSLVNIALVYVCYFEISYEDFYKISGITLLDKLLN